MASSLLPLTPLIPLAAGVLLHGHSACSHPRTSNFALISQTFPGSFLPSLLQTLAGT